MVSDRVILLKSAQLGLQPQTKIRYFPFNVAKTSAQCVDIPMNLKM